MEAINTEAKNAMDFQVYIICNDFRHGEQATYKFELGNGYQYGHSTGYQKWKLNQPK